MADIIMGMSSRGEISTCTVEAALIHVHRDQPKQLLEITILHELLPWYSTNFILATSLWTQYYCAHFTHKETETRKDQVVRGLVER